MALTAPIVPAATDTLCEGCGYILRGLDEAGACPECGRPIAQSLGRHRKPTAFESNPTLGSLIRTAFAVFFRPARFFATLAVWFARCHRATAAALFAVGLCAIAIFNRSSLTFLRKLYPADEPVIYGVMLAPAAVVTYAAIAALTRLAATLIAWLAADRALRLQPKVIRRALDFQAVHWAPVAFAIDVAVGGLFSLQLTPLAVILYIVVARLSAWLAGGKSVRRGWAVGVPVFVLMVVVVCCYFALFDSSYFDHVGMPPVDWRSYTHTLLVLAAAGMGWLLLTAWLAIRNVMYGNSAR